MSEHAAHGEHAHEHGTKIYWIIFAALMILTVVTVGVSRVDLGRAGNIALGVAVACVKATLVVLWFMHMKEDGKDKFLVIAIIFPLVLFLLLAFALMPDIAFRFGDQSRVHETGAAHDAHGGHK